MFSYTLLQILKAPGRSFQLLLSAVIVFTLIFSAMAFDTGMSKSLNISGDPLNVMILGMGSEESVERSEVDPGALSATRAIPGIKKVFDQPAVSPEVVFNTNLKIENKENESLLRGVTPIAMNVYQSISISSGAFPKTGEVMVGRLFHQKFGLDPSKVKSGQTLVFEGREFTISGEFKAPGSVMESEVWMNLNELMALTQRDRFSSITIRLEEADYGDIELMTKRRQDLQVSAISEDKYYHQVSSFFEPIRWMAWLTAILIASGALFGGMNSTFAAFDNRKKEFSTLQALGYGPYRLGFSMLLEATLINLAAYVIAGTLALAILPQVSMGFGSVYFSLYLGSSQIVIGLGLALLFSLMVTTIPAIHLLVPPLYKHLKN